jgi:hypothetical protein
MSEQVKHKFDVSKALATFEMIDGVLNNCGVIAMDNQNGGIDYIANSTRFREKLAIEAKDVKRIVLLAPQLLEALEAVEWGGSRLDGDDYNPTLTDCICPCCGNHELEGHEKTCKLAAALAAAKGEQPC